MLASVQHLFQVCAAFGLRGNQIILPNAKSEFLGGHMMFWEYPERFNAMLDKYLEERE